VARAQTAQETQSFPVERLRLAMDGDGVFDVEWGNTQKAGAWGLGLWIGYEDDPLVAYDRDTDDRIGSLVHRRVGAALSGSFAILDWLEVGLEVPLVLYQARPADFAGTVQPLGDVSKLGLGDLRLAPKLRLFGTDDGLSLALVPSITFPTGGGSDYFGDDGLTFAPEAALSVGGPAGLRFAVNAGYRVRPKSTELNLTVDDEIFARVGGGLRFGNEHRTEVALTLGGAFSAKKPFDQSNQTPLELLAYAGYDFVGPLLGFVGAGVGLDRGFGTPDWRVLVGLRFAVEPEAMPLPPVAVEDGDPDHDGIFYNLDRCPNQAEDKDGYQDTDGCPDPDNDGDGQVDLVDKCPNEPETKNGFQDDDGCPDVADSDGDGIADDKDKCPKEAEDKDGFQDDDGCPDPDNDDDKVLDVDDKCPMEPGPAANHGCPDKDTDGDGVVDREDNCPDEPGPAKNHGCKEKQLAVITEKGIDILDVVYFDTSKDVIQKRSYKLLDNVAQVINAHPQAGKFRVEGHTDDRGENLANLDLSQRRAQAVVTYLVGKGVPAERLQAVGFGETKPIADNKTKAGRAKNRRVEFKIIGKDDAIEQKQTGPEGEIKD
jgi:outer membrane protein OmpA-like peptidoglycan-associated protein